MAEASHNVQDLFNWWENLNTQVQSRAEFTRLLVNGANVNQANRNGRTPLMIICWKYQGNDIVSLIQSLLDNRANVQQIDNYGWNALLFICRFNYTEQLVPVIKLLLTHNIDVNAVTKNQWCALHQLCQHNSSPQLFEAIRTLVEHGANIDAKTSRNDTAIHLLFRFNHSHHDFEAIFDYLLARLARMDIITSNGKTLLHTLCCYAVDLNLARNVNRLLQRFDEDSSHSGNNWAHEVIDARDYYGNTAILYAAKLGCIQTVSLLLPRASLNSYDGFEKNATDYLKDIILNQSVPLCTCCRQQGIDLNSDIFEGLESKERVNYQFKLVNKNHLESSIPSSMDRGFTYSPKSSPIYLPEPENWNELVRDWNSGSILNMALIYKYLDAHCHNHENDSYWSEVSHKVQHYVRLLTDKAAEFDYRFQGQQLHYGSSAEKTKILSPDEFDFMIVLKRFQESANTPESVVSNCKAHTFHDNAGNTSSARLLYYYYQLLFQAIHQVNYFYIVHQNISYGETCVTLHLLYRHEIKIGEPLLKISVDITVGVARSLYASQPYIPSSWPSIEHHQYLVPHRRVSSSNKCRWKPSFPSMERDIFIQSGTTVRRCYRLLKLLVLLSQSDNTNQAIRKTEPSSYVLKTCILIYMKRNPPPWDSNDIIERTVGICYVVLNAPSELNSLFKENMYVAEITHHTRQFIEKIITRLMPSLAQSGKPQLTLPIAPSTQNLNSGSSHSPSNNIPHPFLVPTTQRSLSTDGHLNEVPAQPTINSEREIEPKMCLHCEFLKSKFNLMCEIM